MALLSKLLHASDEQRYSFNEYAALTGTDSLLWPGQLVQTWTSEKNAEPGTANYTGFGELFKTNGPVFALMAIRLRLFSQVRWCFQNNRTGSLFSAGLAGTPNLDLVNDDPMLNAWMIRHVDLAGNFYGVIRPEAVYPLRPDWVAVIGDGPLDAFDTEILGYAYMAGGPQKTPIEKAQLFLAQEVIHWMPEPDPDARWRGMSWLTSVLREIAADTKSTLYKDKYLHGGATPNMFIKVDASTSFENFEKFKQTFRDEYEGPANAGKTLFLGGGADATVIGANLQQLDFSQTQGKGETRLANAAGIHPAVIGFSEGMQGAALNAGNFGQARRQTADTLLHPLWVSAAGALGEKLEKPSGAKLWYDSRAHPFLREDAMDDARIKGEDAATMQKLIAIGFTPDSVKVALEDGNWSLLEHTGLYSVQLQPPMTSTPANGTASMGRSLQIVRDEHGYVQGVEEIL